ncbi:MAG: hypothetical protein ACK5LF_21370 [Bacteroides xylanisolvens]
MDRETLHNLIAPYLPMLSKVLLFYLFNVIAILADLWSGIRKSKKQGIYTHSYGLRQTTSKISRNFNILFGCTIVDFIIIVGEFNTFVSGIINLSPNVPYITFIASIVLCGIEVYSIFEKDENKGKYIEAARFAKEVMKQDKMEEMAEIIIKKLEEKQKEGKDESK